MKLIIIALLLLSSFILNAQSERATYKKLERSLKLIDSQYADTVDAAKIATAAVKAMIAELDPHSKYLSPKDLKKNNEQLNGSFAGIGIHYQIINDTLLVLNTVKGGPAEQAGVKAGDRLIEIDGETSVGKIVTNSYLSKKLRGKRGTIVSLKLISHNNEIKNVNIKRNSIAIHTLASSYMIDKNTAYIRIKSFSRTTNSEVQIALMQLSMMGMKNIIVDLRDNPGGLMIASINLSDDFLDADKLIVYTKGAHSPRTEYKSKPGGQLEKGKLIVLIDENSASAAEIFAGAIQDWDRGIIMGRRSFGKGLVGRNFNLPDGSAIRLTTGRYYTPSGRCIQKSFKANKTEYSKDILERYERGELYSADSIHFNDSLKYYTNAKRIVYGGGAIMPDIFVPIDTSFYSDYLKQLNRYGIVNLFAGIYFDENIESLKTKFPTIEKFDKYFGMSDKEFDELNKLAFSKDKIKGSESDIAISKEHIKAKFKAYLARDIYQEGYYRVYNKLDNLVLKATKIINSDKAFKENKIQY